MQTLPIRPANSRFTDKQWQSIYDSGSNLLISASAGSGKTTVLVKRVIEKIKSGVNVDELLIVTFTEAAAREMKERIEVAIQEAINDEELAAQKHHFVEQLSLLPMANISTLHAFCLRVIRKYYYLIEIDPVFRPLTDETETILLKEDAWNDLRESLYEEEADWFYELVENFSSDRNDDGLTTLIIALYHFSRSHPNPDEWLASLATHYDTTQPFTSSKMYRELFYPLLSQMFEESLIALKDARILLEGEETLAKPLDLVRQEYALVESLMNSLRGNDINTVYQLLASFTFARWSSPRKAEEAVKEVNQEAKALRDTVKERLEELKKGIFAHEPEQISYVMKEAQVYVRKVASLTNAFADSYRQKKAEKKLVDFNDLEHMTLAILQKEDENGVAEASRFYRQQFKEVMVDEYQDVNRLQEAILTRVTSEEVENGNLFMVGDVKQSIYGFRLADPTLFIEKYEAFANETSGRRIILAENFRSRAEVIDFTNLIFKQLMNREVGQLEYDSAAELQNGFKDFPENPACQTEVLIFENKSETKTEVEEGEEVDFTIDSGIEGEILLIANKIKQMKQEGMLIYDKKKKSSRPIEYSDIVILSPTKKNNLLLVDRFAEEGIPIYVNDAQNYFQATEVRIMMSLLTIIDNPYQDIPLVSVLRSPIVGLKENELSTIRLKRPFGYYYDALQAYIRAEDLTEEEHVLQEKLKTFHQRLVEWRVQARRGMLSDLIWQIYQETHLLDYVGGLPSAKQRQANLHALYERAEAYEKMSYRGLFQFVRFIEKMQEKDKDLAEATTEVPTDAVKVMTIHGSKGLEFPVVFVMDLNKRFNKMDLRTHYIFDETWGMGIKWTDSFTRIRYESLPYQLISAVRERKLLAEEMRKLYVALTRAEEKLILVGSYDSKDQAIKKWGQTVTSSRLVLPDTARLSANSLMDWIGMGLMRHPDADSFNEDKEPAKVTWIMEHPARFTVSFYDYDALRTLLSDTRQATPAHATISDSDSMSEENQPDWQVILDKLEASYDYDAATKTASYQSVSEIKRVFEDPDDRDLLTLDLAEQPVHRYRYTNKELARPRFFEREQTVSAAEIGTAMHLLLQRLSLANQPTLSSLEALTSELVLTGAIDAQVAKKMPLSQIISFFESEFGRELLINHQVVKREQPFSMMMPAYEIFADYPQTDDSQLLIHGIIDGYFKTETGVVLYDFKTDYLPENASAEVIERVVKKYRGQMYLYQKALEHALKEPVKAVKLVLLSINHVVDLR